MRQRSKVCTQCRKSKPLMEFYRCRDGKRGRVSACKSCHRAYARTRPPAAIRRILELRGMNIDRTERADRHEESVRGGIISRALATCPKRVNGKTGHGKPRPGWEIRLEAVRLEERLNTERLRDFGVAEAERRVREIAEEIQEQQEVRARLKVIEERAMLEVPESKAKRRGRYHHD